MNELNLDKQIEVYLSQIYIYLIFFVFHFPQIFLDLNIALVLCKRFIEEKKSKLVNEIFQKCFILEACPLSFLSS